MREETHVETVCVRLHGSGCEPHNLSAASTVESPESPRHLSGAALHIHCRREAVTPTGTHTVFTAALLVTAKRWKQPKCPLAVEWIHMVKHHSASKTKKILTHVTTLHKVEQVCSNSVNTV